MNYVSLKVHFLVIFFKRLKTFEQLDDYIYINGILNVPFLAMIQLIN